MLIFSRSCVPAHHPWEEAARKQFQRGLDLVAGIDFGPIFMLYEAFVARADSFVGS